MNIDYKSVFIYRVRKKYRNVKQSRKLLTYKLIKILIYNI